MKTKRRFHVDCGVELGCGDFCQKCGVLADVTNIETRRGFTKKFVDRFLSSLTKEELRELHEAANDWYNPLDSDYYWDELERLTDDDDVVKVVDVSDLAKLFEGLNQSIFVSVDCEDEISGLVSLPCTGKDLAETLKKMKGSVRVHRRTEESKDQLVLSWSDRPHRTWFIIFDHIASDNILQMSWEQFADEVES